MNELSFSLRRGLLVLAVAWATIPSRAEEGQVMKSGGEDRQAVRDIGSRRQLFIDSYVIGSWSNLSRTFHPAKKMADPVLVPEHAWEGVGTPTPGVYLFGNVIPDEEVGGYKLWYTSWTGSGDSKIDYANCYATSRDGIHWVKPLNLNAVPFKGQGSNNIIGLGWSCMTVLKDGGEPDATKRYKAFFHDESHGEWAKGIYSWSFSPDGIHWGAPVPVPAFRGMHDACYVALDPDNQLYIAALKKFDKDYVHPLIPGGLDGQGWRRWFLSTSKDMQNWTPPVEMPRLIDETDKAMYVDGEGCLNLNTYYISTYAYHGVYIGIQCLFRITAKGGYRNCQDGPMDVRLLFSRDATRQWQIPSRTFLIPRGDKGAWDAGMILSVAGTPIVHGEEWWYYYSGWDGTHGTANRRACIGIAKLRVDGFMSIDAVSLEGVLETHPLVFRGSQLLLNIDASGQDTTGNKNYARVELLGEDGRPLAGFAKEDCDALHVNRVNQAVTWKGRQDVSALAGRQIRMKVYLKGAELYAFQFVN